MSEGNFKSYCTPMNNIFIKYLKQKQILPDKTETPGSTGAPLHRKVYVSNVSVFLK